MSLCCVVRVNVVMLSVDRLNVIMLNVARPNVVILSVVAPPKGREVLLELEI
jgi:hypothetical protein